MQKYTPTEREIARGKRRVITEKLAKGIVKTAIAAAQMRFSELAGEQWPLGVQLPRVTALEGGEYLALVGQRLAAAIENAALWESGVSPGWPEVELFQ